MFNNHVGLGSPPLQPLDQPAPFEQLTQGELLVIHQLRRLQQQREQHIPVVGRHEPLGMVTHEGRQYLEIRQGFSPILVPSHMLTIVRSFLSDNLPRHVRSLATQVRSPPQSPHSNAPSLYFPLSPSAESPATPQASTAFAFSENTAQMSDFGSALAQSSATLLGPMPTPQYSMSSPVSQLAGSAPTLSALSGLGSSVNNMPNGLGMAPSPYQSSFMDTDDTPPMSLETASSQTTSIPQATRPRSVKKPSSTKPRKSAKSLSKNTFSSSPPRESSNDSLGDDVVNSNGESMVNRGFATPGLSNEADESSKAQPSGDAAIASDDDEHLLRKPANAFILYRQAQNLKLRSERPGINVESASILIGKSWKTESDDVKFEFQELARQAREQYFAKKKRIQMHKRLRKVEREELVPSSSSKTITKPRRQTSGSMGTVNRLVISASRELSSFLPEAIASMSANSRQDRAQTQMSLAEHPARLLTLSFEGHSSAALATSTSPSLANNDLSSTTLTPALGRLDTGTNFHFGSGNNHNELGSFFANPPASESAAMAISQQVAASLEHLKAAFSETMQSPLLTAMAIDASPLTAPSTSTEWATSVATASASSQGEWEGVFSTLFNKGS